MTEVNIFVIIFIEHVVVIEYVTVLYHIEQ
nr:MAG TPA: hypothetical protein [Caudoviricetes sp.]